MEKIKYFYYNSSVKKYIWGIRESNIMYFESVCNKILNEIIGEENLPRKELNVKKYKNKQ